MSYVLRRALAAALALPAVLALAVAAPSAAEARPGPRPADTYSASLATAISDLPVAAEVRTGYDRDLFTHWVDDDGDGCDTREEVLLAEADDPPTRGSGCALSGGRWYSYYDGVSQFSPSDLDIDHVVPLAEAWDSGARSWSSTTRRAYANDLGDSRSLVAVTGSVNRAKGDQDVAEWLPARDRCRYLREFVAVKVRWRLTVDSAEKSAMRSLASDAGCTGTITLARAR